MLTPEDRYIWVTGKGKTSRHKLRRREPDGRLETVHSLLEREYGTGRYTIAEEKGRGEVCHPYTITINFWEYHDRLQAKAQGRRQI